MAKKSGGGTTFAPLSLELINEGLFMERVNASLLDMQQGLERFRVEHKEGAQKARAKLSIEVELVVVDHQDGGYGIKATYKSVLPRHPASTSMAMAGETQDGRPALMVRQSGSDRDSPRQNKLFDKPASDDE